jgi:hypothetical protein
MFQFIRWRLLFLGPIGIAFAMASLAGPDGEFPQLAGTIQRGLILGDLPDLPVEIQRKLVLPGMVESQVDFVLGTRGRNCDTTFVPGGVMVSYYPDANLAVWYSADGKVTSALKSTAEEVRRVTGKDPGLATRYIKVESSIVISHPKK